VPRRWQQRHWQPHACVCVPLSQRPLCAAAPHLASPQGITTAIAYQHGMGSSAFALAVALSSIVMYDAAGVRRHAGAAGWSGPRLLAWVGWQERPWAGLLVGWTHAAVDLLL
jgi:hypothetical protein